MYTRAFLVATAASVVAISALAAELVTVSQKGLRFSETDITIAKGQVVAFMNDDRATHNITVDGEGISVNGGLQPPGTEFRMPFAKPGTYLVSCGIHPKMKLTVTVK